MDIVERLRPHGLMGQSAETRLRQEAADEIERLREALQKIVKESEISIDEQDSFNGLLAVEYIARSALQQKDSE